MATPDTSPSSITLSLLRVRGWRSGNTAAIALSRKDAGLLALLALDGAFSRDLLAQMLWPDSGAAQARTSLRQRCFRLARSAGVRLVEGEETLQLAAGVDHEARDPEAWLRRDAAALQGELLEGLSFDDCPEYARWLDGARERWRVTRALALGRLASRLQEQGNMGGAIEVARRLCAEEPLSEHAHRQLMELHYVNGDLGAALHEYQLLAARLEAELGEIPDDETAALAARLRLGQAPARTAARTGVPLTLRRPPRLIGREAACAALVQARARRVAVVVEGAPGMGKTRLLTDFVAGSEAGAALLVAARAGDAQRPYALLVRLLARLWLDTDALRPDVLHTLPEWARHELAALLPELGAGTPRTQALRLQRAVQVALQQAELEVVALDDVQNADAATLELLASWQGAPGLPGWAVACRAGELPAPIGAWLQASDAPQRVLLQPLRAGEIEALLQDLALPEFEAQQWAHTLSRHTGGLPLFILETLRVLLEQPAKARESLPLPMAVAQAIRARAAHLPEAARQIAHAAAVLRAPVSPEAGAALLGGQPAQWVGPHALLEAAHWVDARGVMHDVVSAALREAMPGAEQRWLHSNVARWLVQTGGSGQEVAQHFEQAGMDEQAAEQFEAGARLAHHASRPAEEASLWEEAARSWERAGRSARVFQALSESVSPRSWASGIDAALATVERMTALASSPLERAAALCSMGMQLVRKGSWEEALPILLEARTLATKVGVPQRTVTAVCWLAHCLTHLDRAEEALAAIDPALPLLDQCGQDSRSEYLNARSHACWSASRMEECLAGTLEQLAIAKDAEDWRGTTLVTGILSMHLGIMGRIGEAIAASEESLRYKARLGPVQGVFMAVGYIRRGEILMNLGQLGGALDAFQQATSEFPSAAGHWPTTALHAAARCHLLRNSPDAARQTLQSVRCDESVPDPTRAHHLLLQAGVAAAAGEEPGSFLQQAREIANGASRPSLRLEIEAEVMLLGPVDPQPDEIFTLEQQARALQQGAIATRLAWHRVDALCRCGKAAEAAERACELLAQPLWPTGLLPCHWLWIAQAALEAAGDPRAPALAARAREAHAQTLADLKELSGPPAQWPGPMSGWRRHRR